MPLKISLKPYEKIFIGGAVVRNGGVSVELDILNDVSLLREKDILTEEEAKTLCQRIYLCVQLMYMDAINLRAYQQNYRQLVDAVLGIDPETAVFLGEINNDLACGRYYQALKCAQRLVDYEKRMMNHGQKPA